MNLFDIVGPVMIGPSSSHTAGACRLGLLAAGILGGCPKKADLLLHGSFARTYKGHGTDRALLAGLMGWQPDDERLPRALELAKEAGLCYSFTPGDLGSMAHPNSVLFRLTGTDGNTCEVVGASVGGGQIVVTRVDGFPVELTGVLPALFVPHRDDSLSIPFVSTFVFAAVMKHQDAPGTTFKRHMRIAKGVLNEDDYLLQEILFNPYTHDQVSQIRTELKELLEIIDNKDAEGMKGYLTKIRNNVKRDIEIKK